MRQIRQTLLVAVIGLAIGAVLMGPLATESALHTRRKSASSADEAREFARANSTAWEAVRITAEDGAVLEGWLFTPAEHEGSDTAGSGAGQAKAPVPQRSELTPLQSAEHGASVVVLLHGVGDVRASMLGHARYLVRSGFSVLVPDSRGHGESGGTITTYGIEEAGDVARWTSWLFQTHHVEHLYGLGVSLGAGILLQSLAREPRFRAVVAESPFASFQEAAYDRLSEDSGISQRMFWPVIESGFLYARMRYGVDLRRASAVDAVRATHTPILLIHGTADVNIPIRHSRELHAINPGATRLWEVAGATHGHVRSADPEGYARTVVEWFQSHP